MAQDLSRYHRQMLLPGFGEAGQQRLLDSTALVLGCGALGCAVADTLARAGVGRLVIVDRDFVELTNLQRQVLFDERDLRAGLPKAEAAKRRLAQINSGIAVTAVVDDLNPRNIERHAAGADVLVDGLDNFETRYLVNDFAVRHGLPYVYGGAVGTSGAACAILPHTPAGSAPWETPAQGGATPCLRCLFDEPPPPGSTPTCETAGVLAPAVAMVASFEAAEALKILTGRFDRVCRTLLNLDLWANAIKQFKIDRAYEAGLCLCCGQRDFEYLEGRRGSGAAALCGREAVQILPRPGAAAPDFDAIAARLRAHGPVTVNEFVVRAAIVDAGHAYELTLFRDGRAIVKGTAETAAARGLFARYVGT